MSKPFLEKSTQTMQTAEMLLKQRFFPSTVNRAYYSCLQFILHIVLEKQGHTFNDLKKLPGNGTHSQAQYLLESTLVKLVGADKTDYKWFQQKFPEIKELRVTADYEGDPMNYDAGQKAINLANSIIYTLKKYYK